MAWSIVDKGEGDNDIQSILFQEYLDVLVAGLSGIDCVLSGCAVTGGADMTPAVAKGAVLSNRTLFAVTAGDVTIGAADATNPRIDLIVVTSAGAKAVRAGTAAANPKPPARSANDVVLAAVYVPANDTTIASTQITDLRTSPSRPQTIFKRTSNTATGNTTGRVDVLNLTIPSGLLVAGEQLEFLITGTILLNSGTPTVTFSALYGGTTLLSEASAAATADADRLAFKIHGLISSEANADQKIGGTCDISLVGAKAAPGTGRVGEMAATNLSFPFAGALGTVDSDAADRALVFGFTMSVANAANEVDVEQAVVRLN